jgi:hypothetical protein
LTITSPAFAEIAMPPGPARRPSGNSSSSGKRKKKKKSSEFPTQLVGGLIGVVVVAGLAYAAFKLFKKSPDATGGPQAVTATGQPTAVPGATPAASGWQVKPDGQPGGTLPPLSTNALPVLKSLGYPGVTYTDGSQSLAVVHVSTGPATEYRLWDLAAGSQRGKTITIDRAATKYAVSQGGEFLAVRPIKVHPPKKEGERERLSSCEAELWSFDSGQKVRSIPLEADDDVVAWLEFASPKRLVSFAYVGVSPNQTRRFRVWDPETGKMIRETPWAGLFADTKACLSPGGRFLANIDGFQFQTPVQIIDIENGTVAGTLSLEAKNSAGESYEWVTMAFSPDKLAILRTSQQDTELTVFGCNDGKLLKTHHIPGQVFQVTGGGAYQGRQLEWAADGKSWLILGTMILDDESGQPVWLLDPKSLTTQRLNTTARRLYNDRLVFFHPQTTGLIESDFRFASYDVPWSTIRSASPQDLPVRAALP